MADHDGDDPDDVLPFITRESAANHRRSTGDGRVAELGFAGPTVPWRGDEEWVSTLPDPHYTTGTDEPE